MYIDRASVSSITIDASDSSYVNIGAILDILNSGRSSSVNLGADSSSLLFVHLIFAQTLRTALKNGSKAYLDSGEVEQQTIEQRDSTDCYAKDLVSHRATVILNGSGDVYVRATETLHVEMLGTGRVWYYGNPAVTTSGNGTGNIIKAD